MFAFRRAQEIKIFVETRKGFVLYGKGSSRRISQMRLEGLLSSSSLSPTV
jgi:hypothetical protein